MQRLQRSPDWDDIMRINLQRRSTSLLQVTSPPCPPLQNVDTPLRASACKLSEFGILNRFD